MAKGKSIKVGDLVCLSKKGERFIYGKVLCSPYYKPILQGNLGLVTSISTGCRITNSSKKGNTHHEIRVVWFVRNGEETTTRPIVVMTMNERYIKRLNKR